MSSWDGGKENVWREMEEKKQYTLRENEDIEGREWFLNGQIVTLCCRIIS